MLTTYDWLLVGGGFVLWFIVIWLMHITSPEKITKKVEKPQLPPWACLHWGDYEHDWIDCPDCNENYEAWLEGRR